MVTLASSGLSRPAGMAYDTAGNLYIADSRDSRVVKLSPSGVMTTVAGTGVQGFAGDGGLATAAELDTPVAVAVSVLDVLYIADTHNHRIRSVATDGTIRTVAGSGMNGSAGDGGVATAAQMRMPVAVAVDSSGAIYIGDSADHRVRRVDVTGTIQTVAGTGEQGFSGDGGPATAARLDSPSALAVDDAGDLLIADRGNHRVRRVNASGVIQTILGGDEGSLRGPQGLAADARGNVYIADTGNHRVQQVNGNSIAGTVAGSGTQGSSSGATARDTEIDSPRGIAAGSQGSLTIADRGNNRIVATSSAAISFGMVASGSVSASHALTIMNRGDAVLHVDAVTIPSGFLLDSGTCGAVPITLAAGQVCIAALTFAPSSAGSYAGQLMVSGIGVLAKTIVLSGTASTGSNLMATQTVLDIHGAAGYTTDATLLTAQVLSSNAGTPTGTVTFYDGTSLLSTSPLQTSIATYSGLPLTTGVHALSASYSGDSIFAASNSASVTKTVSLPVDFQLFSATGAGTTQTVTAGGSALFQIVLQPQGGSLSRTVTMTISGLPPGAIASFDPATVFPGSNGQTILLTIKTLKPNASRVADMGVSAILLTLLLAQKKKRMRWAGFFTLFFLAGCSGGFKTSSNGSDVSGPKTYAITITASAASASGVPLVHSMVVMLRVE
jgi:sugar lactone lactonase YvrE